MKFIHTADWHLGKIIHEVNLLEEQKYILNQFLEVIDREKPDAIFISGDLYDRAVPSKEAVHLLDNILYEIIMVKKVPVFIVSGNHDSGERLEFASRLLRNNGLYIKGKLEKDIEKVTLQDEAGNINIYMLPFSYVSEIKYIYDNQSISDFNEAYKVMIGELVKTMNKEERNILLAHGFIINSSEEVLMDDSVRPLSVGNTEYVHVDVFEDFDYVALGHLHRPLKVKWDKVRYSGSLMKYSFSEHNQKKGLTIVEIAEKGNLSIRHQDLHPLRDLQVIEGKLEELINPEFYKNTNVENYIRAILLDEDPIYDGFSLLKGIYPNILRMDYKIRKGKQQLMADVQQIKNHKNDVELFEMFYGEMTDKEFTGNKRKIVEKLFEEIIEE